MDNQTPPEDDLLKRARILQQTSQDAANDHEKGHKSFFERVVDSLKNSSAFTRSKNFGVGVQRAYETAGVIWNSYLNPLSYIVNPLARLYWNGCKRVFNHFSFDSEGNFNKFRAAPAVLLLTAFTAVAGYQVATNAVPFTLNLVYDAAVIETFSHEETLIFGQAHILDVDRNLWGVSACTEYPCEAQDDTIEYRMRDSAWLDLKRLITHFEPHDPGELQAAFNSEQSVCNIETYGRRIKLPIVPISWGTWPLITDATCVPVDSDNWQQQIEYMQGLRASSVQPAPALPAQ